MLGCCRPTLSAARVSNEWLLLVDRLSAKVKEKKHVFLVNNMAADTQEIHRPGAFKQQNKPHKHGKHKSKGQLERGVKGILGSCLLIIDIHSKLVSKEIMC